MSLLGAALQFQTHGYSIVPAATNGTKAPAIAWKQYTTTPADQAQIHAWFDNDTYDGFGIICGAVSGNLEMFEIEGRATNLIPQLATLMADNGYSDLWARLCAGYLEQSPSGGMHWLMRVDGPARPNTKLARRPGTPDGVDVLIETRGEGGFTVTAPSGGRTHPTGKPWTVIAGTPDTIPVISIDERDALHAIASMLDQMPTQAPIEHHTTPGTIHTADQVRPGDDYNQRTSWDDILTPLGWQISKRFASGGLAWTRPGKNVRDGISATTGTSSDGIDRLYVFSTSTEFEPEKPYTKFAAHTLLEHNGNYAAAAASLAKNGYGSQRTTEQPRTVTRAPETVTADNVIPINGNTITKPQLTVVEPDTYSLTDDGNALRLVDTYQHQIRYCPQRGQWLRWDTSKWTWDEAETIQELARTTARTLPSDGKDERAHRKISLSARGISAMMRLARSDTRTVIHVSALDAKPYELNTPNGIVNLRTGTLRPPDPAALHTRTTTVTPAAGPAPRWNKFLADTFAGDPALTTYVQRLIGVSLIGTVLEQLLPFPFGAGANGKTTLLGVVQRLIGIGDGGYSISAPADMLLATQHQGHPTELARLSGARVVVTSELEDGQRFAEAKVKQLTGRDVIAGRFMRQDWFSFQPTHTLWLLANHQPEVRAGGPAFWRRIALLPFLHTVPPEQRDAHLEDTLVETEGPQILAWLLQGAVDYLNDGLARPESVTTATDAYAKDQDTVARFVEECCDTAPAGTQTFSVASSKVRQEYESWCRQEGETPIPAKTLTLQLRSRFDVMSERTMKARVLSGIRLKPQIIDDSNAQDRSSGHEEANPWTL